MLCRRRGFDVSLARLAVMLTATTLAASGSPSARVVYYLHTVPATWNEARAMCDSYNAVLLCLADMNATNGSIHYVDTRSWGGALSTAQAEGLWTGLYKKSDGTTLAWLGCTPYGTANSSLISADTFCYKAADNFRLSPENCDKKLQYICQLNDGQCWFQPRANQRISDSDVRVRENETTADDESACAKLCRDGLLEGMECWAFSFGDPSKHCVLYFTDVNHKYSLTTAYFVNQTGTTVYEKICTGGWKTTLSPPRAMAGNPTDENCTFNAEGDSGDPGVCYCECDQPPVILTAEDLVMPIEEKAEQIQKELYVDPDNTSSSRRKKICVEDDRPSAQSIGYLGVVFMTVVFGGIVLLDLPVLVSHIKKLVLRIRSKCIRRVPQKSQTQ